MNILITGSSGLIGSKLKTSLQESGHTVFCLLHNTNNSTPEKDLTWSIKNNYVRIDQLAEIDAVVHLAGSNIAKPWTKNHKKSIYESRVNGTELLINYLKSQPNRIKHFISTSAIGYYPNPTTSTCDESATSGIGFLSDVCVDWEKAAQPIQSDLTKLSIVRVGLVLAMEGGLLPVAGLTRKLGIVPNTGSKQNIWSWIHLTDLVEIFKQLATGELKSGTYNAVSPNPCEQGTFAKSLIQATKLKGQRILPLSFTPSVPSFLLRMILGERSVLPLTSQHIQNKGLEAQAFEFKHPEIQGALEDLIA
jgi:hypothetical protein